jgi:hypothetical protein
LGHCASDLGKDLGHLTLWSDSTAGNICVLFR